MPGSHLTGDIRFSHLTTRHFRASLHVQFFTKHHVSRMILRRLSRPLDSERLRMEHRLSAKQVQQFHDEGFLIVRDLLPQEALRPLIEELERKVDDSIREAVKMGTLDAADTFEDTSFATRLGLVSAASSDGAWLWHQVNGKQNKTAGMFTLRTWPSLLDVAESLIGPEILAHPQTVLRAKLPDQEKTVVPWHQDLAYLIPEKAGETLVVNFWVPMVDATEENGCLQVIQGSHRAGLLPHDAKISGYIGVQEADLPEGDTVICEVDVGDVLLTMERTVHRSTPNRSENVRWSVDTRYSRLGLPTGRPHAPGFVARSRENPESVARSYLDWRRLYTDAGLDWREQ
jgi:phytanoyl-CoA hydroxylase